MSEILEHHSILTPRPTNAHTNFKSVETKEMHCWKLQWPKKTGNTEKWVFSKVHVLRNTSLMPKLYEGMQNVMHFLYI